MKEFCCSKFQFFYSGSKEDSLNIRIVKLSDEFIQRGNIKIDRSCFITAGYSGDITECVNKMAINYCPFCGSLITSHYKSEEYIQEIVNL